MKKILLIASVICALLLQGCAAGNGTESRAYKWKIGMTQAQVLGSVDGAPRQKSKTTTAYGTTEIWFYGRSTLLFFDESGILRQIDSPY